LKLWDAGTGKELLSLESSDLNLSDLAFSPDGKHLATSSRDSIIKIWDAANGKLLRALTGHQQVVGCLVFSPDGKHLVSGSADKTLKLWDVIFSPDGRRLASAARDNTVRIWEGKTGQELLTLGVPFPPLEGWFQLAFSPDGRCSPAA
jgi:WD40 repeat protein